jgi:hypothetical protein
MPNRLIAIGVASVIGLSGASVPQQLPVFASCSSPGSKIGPCPEIDTAVSGNQVDMEANGSTSRGGVGNGNSNGGSFGEADPNAWNAQREAQARANGNYRDAFQVVNPPAPPTVVTLNDIASFTPAAGGNHMEPTRWIVVGLDTNFYSDATPRVVDGTLLGLPAAVRFTPVEWRWSYGDGSSRNSATPGSSWKAQNLPEFEPTATSHVFADTGSYTIDLTVEYSAEYQFAGSGWVAIAGRVSVPANRIVATANDADTVLVNRDCRQNPRGPGC